MVGWLRQLPLHLQQTTPERHTTCCSASGSCQDTPITADWNCERLVPVKIRIGNPDFSSLLLPKPEAKMASGFQQPRSLPNQRFQTAHCPYRHQIKRLRLLGARKLMESDADNLNPRHSADPGDLFQEGSLLCDRFKKNNVEIWGNQLDRKSRETGTATDIEQASCRLDCF